MSKKRLTVCAVLAALVLICASLQGCGAENDLVPEGKITRISAGLLPYGAVHVFEDEESIGRIRSWFSGIALNTDFKEDPLKEPFGEEDEAWVFDFEFEDGSVLKIFNIKSVYVKTPQRGWYKTSRSDGEKFEKMIKDLTGRP